MRKLLHAIIPGLPPTVNHLYRTSGNNKRYKTREVRRFGACNIVG